MRLSPGQDIDELILRISADDIEKIVGKDIAATVHALAPHEGLSPALRKIASDIFSFRANELLSSRRVRAICHEAMTSEKLDELAVRLSLTSRRSISAWDPSTDSVAWQEYLGFFGFDGAVSAPAVVEMDAEDIEPGFSLYPHQRRAADRVLSALDGGYGRVVLHMPTGSGKTRTAMHIFARFLNSTEPTVLVWLAASAELLDQAAEAFQTAWAMLGNRKVALLRCWGDYAPDLASLEDGVIVASLQKMRALGARESLDILRLGSKVKLVVVDEAHQAIAPTYREVITRLSDSGAHNALLGLTATPGRTWSDVAADRDLAEFFDERKVMLDVEGSNNPVAYLMNEGYLARPTFRQLDYTSSPTLKSTPPAVSSKYDDYGDQTLAALAQDIDRNVVVVRETIRLTEAGHNRILVFTASVRHAEITSAALCALGLDARVVTGGTALRARKRIIRDFRAVSETPMVLCNFGVLTTGLDAPNTSAAVIARPTRSLVLYSQMVGRATRGRKVGGNDECEISTVVDTDLPGFSDVAEAFTNWEDVWDESCPKRTARSSF